MLEVWGIKAIKKENGKIKVMREREVLEFDGESWEIIYGLKNLDPEICSYALFKFPLVVLIPPKGEKRMMLGFFPDLIVKVEGVEVMTIPKEEKYTLYGDVYDGIIARRISLFQNAPSKVKILMRNESSEGIKVEKVLFPMRYLELRKKDPEEISLEFELRIRGKRHGEVEMIGEKKAKCEMLWGFL